MKNHSWPHTIRIIIFSCLIGGAAGVLGTALTTSYLSQYALSLGEVTQNLGLSQTRPRTLPQSYLDALEKLEDQSLPAVGSLFVRANIPLSGISVSDPSATVIGLTSDGWSLSTDGRVGDTVHFGGQTCEVDEVREEPLLDFRFLHCAISNASVVDIAGGYGVKAGDQLFVVGHTADVVFTQARGVVWGLAVRGSDEPSRRILLTADTSVSAGSAVFNVYGELVGIVEESVEGMRVIPFEHLSGAFRQVLEGADAITYPALGVRGIDVSRAVGVSEEISGAHAGFVLYGPRAVAFGSAAQEAGFVVGDVLLSVEGVTINGTYALDDLMANYSAGDVIDIEFEREGARQEVTVTLGEQQF
ncbi:MAG: S1C family serine protease [Patescibacteria group bacterium]